MEERIHGKTKCQMLLPFGTRVPCHTCVWAIPYLQLYQLAQCSSTGRVYHLYSFSHVALLLAAFEGTVQGLLQDDEEQRTLTATSARAARRTPPRPQTATAVPMLGREQTVTIVPILGGEQTATTVPMLGGSCSDRSCRGPPGSRVGLAGTTGEWPRPAWQRRQENQEARPRQPLRPTHSGAAGGQPVSNTLRSPQPRETSGFRAAAACSSRSLHHQSAGAFTPANRMAATT
jgi:hypothetical protein